MSNLQYPGQRISRNPFHNNSQAGEGSFGLHLQPQQARNAEGRRQSLMDNDRDVTGVFSIQRPSNAHRILVVGVYSVYVMEMTLGKAKWLWTEMNKYRTLWNDFTRGDFDSWFNILVSRDSFWLEVWNETEIIGVIYWTDMAQIVDCEMHGMFFDRELASKVELCREVGKWFFTYFPEVHRMTTITPAIYHATIRLLRRVGFREEGRKREVWLMNGNWIDQIISGLLASEVL